MNSNVYANDVVIDFHRIADKSYYKGDEVKAIVEHVVNEVETMVTSTMGPNGQLAVISYGTEPKTTKDGVTVARGIKFTNEAAEYVNRIIVEPALKTDEECGDGTTTTIFLTKLLYNIMEKHSGFLNHKRIEEVVNFMVEKLTQMAILPDVNSDDLYALALTSSNNDKAIAKAIVEVYKNSKTGYPFIELKQGATSADVVEEVSGIPLRMKFAHVGFSKDGSGSKTSYTNFVAVGIDAILQESQDKDHRDLQIKALADLATAYPRLPILLVARSVEIDYCNLVLAVNQKLGSNIIPITTGLGGTQATLLLGDIMTVLGGRLITSDKELGIDNLVASLDTVVVGPERSLLLDVSDSTQERITARITDIESNKDVTMSDRFSVRARFTERRIRDLKGELIVIYVGGETASEVKERLDRFEDVNKAVRSALTNGILPGCGYALREVAKAVDAEWAKEERENEIEYDEIVCDIIELCYQQYDRLYGPLGIYDINEYRVRVAGCEHEYLDKHFSKYVNLATGEEGLPHEIGVFDTAYASITALKGGFKTAKILAQTNTILLGSKLGARQF